MGISLLLIRVNFLITIFLYFRFYSITRPGDTVNVIGEFDKDGKCIVDRNNNLFILHPDILVSGSRVIVTDSFCLSVFAHICVLLQFFVI